MVRKKVCVIGAGISGLVTTKVLLEDQEHFEVYVFEKSHEFGGVWSKSRAYQNLCTNNTKYTFSFSDMPIPDHYDEYPTAAQMLEYFTAYANKHCLLPHVAFNTEVVRAVEAEGKWEVTTRTRDGFETSSTYDFLVVATGIFEQPFIPPFENAAKFRGRILHSAELVNSDVIRDQRVLIVGNGKSAADIVCMCGKFAKGGLMVFRRAHWLVPRYVGGMISTRFLFYGRLYRYIIPYHHLGPFETFIQTALRRVIKGFWKVVTAGVVFDMKVPKTSPLIPDIDINTDGSLGFAPPGYYEAMSSGKIRFEKTEIARFVPDSKVVEFTNGRSEEFDAVVFATGYKQGFPFFDHETIEKLQIPHHSQSGRTMDTPFRLYRSVVPIKGPSNIGFIGYQNCLSNSTLYEIQANWLAEFFLNNIHLPSLLDDMRVSTTRTSNFITEYLFPMYPQRFQIREEKVRQRTSHSPPSPPPLPLSSYFSFSMFVLLLVLFVTIWRYVL